MNRVPSATGRREGWKKLFRRLRWTIWPIIVLGLGACLAPAQTPSKSKVDVAARKPQIRIVAVTIQYQERLHKAGQPDVVVTQMTKAIRSDGSTVQTKEMRALDGATVVNRVKELGFANGDQASVNDFFRHVTAIKTREAFPRDLPLWTPESNCAVDVFGQRFGEPVLEADVLGYKVFGFVRESPSRKVKIWRAPQFGCVELRRLAEFRDGARKSYSTSDLAAIKVTPGPPDGALFDVPSSYERVPFSEHYVRECKRAGRPADPAVLQSYAGDDALYSKRQITDLASLGKTPRQYSLPQ